MEHNWGYHESHDHIAPHQWPEYYRTGDRQSPINILVPELEKLTKSTCCKGNKINDGAALAQRLSGQLSLNNSSNYQSPQHHRNHLDSTGSFETHQRSSSTSSSGSSALGLSASNSPVSGNPSPSGNYLRHTKRAVPATTRSRTQHQDGYDDQDSGGYDEQDYSDKDEHQYNDSPNESANSNHGNNKQNTSICVSNKKIFLGYPRYLDNIQLCNTGHSWQVDLPQELAQHTLISGPPFENREYRLAQLHCHWGQSCNQGSEHLLNGQSFAAELHFVHWNCTDFSSMREAAKHRHGLAVLGVMVQAMEGEQYKNRHLEKITQALRQVQRPQAKVCVQTRLDLKKLFPDNRWLYASYEGSLTTPPLSEVVDWVVFLEPIQCSESQIEQFRQLGCSEGRLDKNHRPVQPHNNRLISIWTHH